MTEPLMRLSLSKTEPDTGKPLKIAFSFRTGLGMWGVTGTGSLAEIKELLPIQIQNAGALYRLSKTLVEVDAE